MLKNRTGAILLRAQKHIFFLVEKRRKFFDVLNEFFVGFFHFHKQKKILLDFVDVNIEVMKATPL